MARFSQVINLTDAYRVQIQRLVKRALRRNTMRNIQTREGYKWWDIFCKLQRFSFWRGDEDEKGTVIQVPNKTGNWIEHQKAAELVDEMQSEINKLESENAALKQRLKIKAV